MGRSFIISGTYGRTTVIYDTAVRNYFATVPAQSSEVVTAAGVLTTLGQGLYDILRPYLRTMEYTALHNLSSGEFDFSIYAHRIELLVNKVTISSIFPVFNTPELFSSASTNAYIKFVSDGDPGYIFFTLISADASTWTSGLWYPYGLARVSTSPDSRYKYLSINLCACNDDGSQPRLITLSTSNINNAVLMVRSPNDSFSNIFPEWIRGIPEWKDTDDPYNPGGNTDPTPKPPAGDFDNTSDPIDVSTLPDLSAVDTRFISLFKPDLTQLQSLASYMWGASFDLETFKKLFNDPMAAILGLSIVPVVPPTAAAAPITLGNITTTISMPKITNQYVQVPCGTLNVNEYWGAYLDYSPFTKLEIYLPYIGVQTLDADDIMGRSVEVVYNIDVLSGACVAQLKCGDSVLYSFAGSCAVSIPITGRDWTNMINGIIGVATAAAGIAVAGATGGASVAAAAAGGALSQTANSLSSMKPTVQKSGTMAAGSGMLAIQKPYLILTRPRQALPVDQNKYTGYPSFITATLGDLTGMTYVYEIHLENIDCTQAEQAEIETLLKNGVIL